MNAPAGEIYQSLEVRFLKGGAEARSRSYLAQGAAGAPPHDAKVLQEPRAAVARGWDGQALAHLHACDGQEDEQGDGTGPHEGNHDPDLGPARLLADCTMRMAASCAAHYCNGQCSMLPCDS